MTQKENLKNSVINWVYFAQNCTDAFIELVWDGEDEHFIQHIKQKFERYGNNANILLLELDEENRTKLVNWVNKNYVSYERYKVRVD